jgi:HEAT repeat protein
VRIQTALIDALGDVGDSRAAALLLERLEAMQPLWCVLDQTDGDKFELLVAIVKALGRVGEPRAIAPLRKVLRWSTGGLESLELENRLQKAVVESLALLGEPNWRQWMLGTDDATVKEARLGGQDYYSDVWFGVRLDDAERLAKSGEECACEVALPVLVRRSGRKVNARQQRAYSLAVKKLGTRRAAEVLVEALLARVGDSSTILLALKEMRESSVVPLLVDSLVARRHLWSGTTTRDLARTVLELGYAPTDEEGMKKLARVYSLAHEYEKAGE